MNELKQAQEVLEANARYFIKALEEQLKTPKDELLIELGNMTLKTDLWTDFNEPDYDNGCKLLDKLREMKNDDKK